MDMTGEHRIPAPRQEVWDALNDPEILKQCIPGCEEIDKLSATEMTAKVTAKVGPVKARFGGKVTLSDLDPPNGYRITGEGSGGAAGFAKGGAAVRLADDSGGTLLSYTVEAHVGGKLAQIGSRLIDATARKMADDFFSRFAQVVGGPAEAPATPAAAAAATPAPTPAVPPAAEAATVAELAPPPASEPAASPVPPPAPAAQPAPDVAAETGRRGLPPLAWVAILAAFVAALLYVFTKFGGAR